MARDNHIKKVQVSPLNAPLIRPFRTALGEHARLENILLSLTLSDGTIGFGEAALAAHITGENFTETFRNLESTGKSLLGRNPGDYLRISSELRERLPRNKSAVAAIEGALFDALTRQMKIPLWKFFGIVPNKLITDITIVIADLKETEESVEYFIQKGFRSFKVKVGRDEDLDIKRVLAVRKRAGRCPIYIDANQGFSAGQTLRFLKSLQKANVRPALIEQPVPRDDFEGLRRVARSTDIPVCADESVRSLSECLRVIRDQAADVINVKLMKFGLIEAREIALLARAKGVKLMIGGMMESSLAMTTSAHLAAGLGCFDYVDLDTPFFVRDGLKGNPCLSPRGVYDVSGVERGVGVEVRKMNVGCGKLK